MNENVLAAIGCTPLVRLGRIFRRDGFQVFAKLEGLNPGGSIKDRAAASIIQQGLASGAITGDTVVIESSSGNMGIGLAQVCAYYDIRFICVIDPKTTAQNIEVLRAYGTEVDLVSKPDPHTGEYLPARIARVKELLRLHKKSFWSSQYTNVYNSMAHHQTMREIVTELNGEVDYLFCATSTCGTLRGCAEYIRGQDLRTRVIAVDAIGSVIFGGEKAKRLIPGHGAARVPELYQPGLAERCVQISDLDCIVGCRRLVRHEGILAGGSSGAVVSAIEQVRHTIPPGATCVTILPDRGERYLDTIYSDDWVHEHFGEVSHLWQQCTVEQKYVTATS